MRLLNGYQTEFYVSNAGYLVIRQESFDNPSPVEIILTPEQAKILFNLSTELMDQQKAIWTGIVDEDS